MQAPARIAVAGATGRVGTHIAAILAERGYEVAPISRAQGVDVITGDGLDAALAGAACVIDASTGPSPEEAAATEFFTTAARNLQQAGQWAGVRRIVVVSIVGTDRSGGGYGLAKLAHEEAMRAGPVPAGILRATQFHEFVAQLLDWGTSGDVGLRAADAHADRRGPGRRPGGRRPARRTRAGRSIRSPRWPGRGSRACPSWRRCSRPGAATRPRSRACPTRPTRTATLRGRRHAAGPGRHRGRPDLRGLAEPTFRGWQTGGHDRGDGTGRKTRTLSEADFAVGSRTGTSRTTRPARSTSTATPA